MRTGPARIIFVRPMASREFFVPSRDLDAAGKQFRFAVRAPWIRGAVEGTDVQTGDRDGELEVRVSKSGTDVVVRGTITAELSVPCARCLQPARVVVREPLSALFVPSSAASTARHDSRDADDTPADEADVLPYDGETVVMDDLVRDEILLGIPMIPLCSEACAGIRPETSEGADDGGIDPRLRPLLALTRKTTA
ncbi:MAG: YceD family protein [Polyangiaceae bacterium]